MPAANYAAGTYGPFAVNSFVSANTDWLEFTLSVENWPDVSPLVRINIAWSTGDTGEVLIPGKQKTSSVVVRFGVPRTATGKTDVSSGTANVVLYRAARTSIKLEALSN